MNQIVDGASHQSVVETHFSLGANFAALNDTQTSVWLKTEGVMTRQQTAAKRSAAREETLETVFIWFIF